MPSRLYRRARSSALFLGATLFGTMHATAQASPTVTRGAEIAPFALATSVSPDYGQTRNLGYSAGVDYTRFFRSRAQPALEFRYTYANGRTVAEKTYLGGLKLQTSVHSVHPYLLVLAGKGYITFNFPNFGYTGDDSIVYAYGGGADFDIAHGFKARVDFTQQHWNFDPNTLTPSAISVGIAYRVPFGSRAVR